MQLYLRNHIGRFIYFLLNIHFRQILFLLPIEKCGSELKNVIHIFHQPYIVEVIQDLFIDLSHPHYCALYLKTLWNKTNRNRCNGQKLH